MMDRRKFAVDCTKAVLTAAFAACRSQAQDAALFRQSAATLLQQKFPDPALRWLLVDTQLHVVAERWRDAALPLSPGSLLKPFVAAAWSDQDAHHQPSPHAPEFTCRGTADRCWLPLGHGRLALPEALAQSCNAYFLSLGAMLDAQTARASFTRFGLHPPSTSLTPDVMIGLADAWRETPFDLLHAYSALLSASTVRAYDKVVTGLRLATLEGTARGAALAFGSSDLLAKTGTAACHLQHTALVDGFAVLLYPSIAPRFLLLVQQHGHTGADAARQAGAILRALELTAL